MRRLLAHVLPAMLLTAAGPAPAPDVNGNWRIDDMALEIYDCQDHVCGKIVWVKDAWRRASDCGRKIVWDLAPSGPSEWAGGRIYDPTDGRTYDLRAMLEADGTLRARVYRGLPLFGKTEILTRVDVAALGNAC